MTEQTDRSGLFILIAGAISGFIVGTIFWVLYFWLTKQKGDVETKITKEWLDKKKACRLGKEWFAGQKETDALKVLSHLIRDGYYSWANWLVVRLMTRRQYIAYALYAAEQAIGVFERFHSADQRLWQVIESIREYLKRPTKENREIVACVNKDAEQSAVEVMYTGVAVYTAACAVNYAALTVYLIKDPAKPLDYATATGTYAGASDRTLYPKIIDYGISLITRK